MPNPDKPSHPPYPPEGCNVHKAYSPTGPSTKIVPVHPDCPPNSEIESRCLKEPFLPSPWIALSPFPGAGR